MNNPENKNHKIDLSNAFSSLSMRRQSPHSKQKKQPTQHYSLRYSFSHSFTKFIPKYPYKRATSTFQRKNSQKSENKANEDPYYSQQFLKKSDRKILMTSYNNTRKQQKDSERQKPKHVYHKLRMFKPQQFSLYLIEHLRKEKKQIQPSLREKLRAKHQKYQNKLESPNNQSLIDFSSVIRGRRCSQK